MRKTIFLLLAVIATAKGYGQSLSDSLAIKETALNYVEGFYASDFRRVEKAVHPELAKRIIMSDTSGNTELRSMGASELVFNAKHGRKRDDKSGEPFKATVTIYDISHNIAIAKVVQNKMRFFDYLQLARVGSEWKIINVLWAMTEQQ